MEFLLTLLRDRRRQGARPQMVLLSAVIGDTNGLERWLAAGLLRSEIRPVPLLEGILCANGDFRCIGPDGVERREALVQREHRKGSAQDLLVPLVRKLVTGGESVIVFRVTKSETRSVAAYLAAELVRSPAQSAIDALPSTDLSAASAGLRACLEHGVAFHNADLAHRERSVVEHAFREREGVRVVVAQELASTLDDAVLDAKPTEQGTEFFIRSQPT